MRRAHYIAHIWNNATVSDPIIFEPDTSGWTLTGSTYYFVWFEGPQLPPSVKDIILDNENLEGNFQLATFDYIPDFFNLLNYLSFSVDNEESEYDSEEDPELEENEEESETD